MAVIKPVHSEEYKLMDIIDNIVYYLFAFEHSARKCENSEGTLKTWTSERIEKLYDIRHNMLELEEQLKAVRRIAANHFT